MTSKLVVNTIEADTGISSVSFASSISMNSTAKFHFSAAGIDIGADTNINRPAAGVLGFNVNGTEKVRIDTNGHIHGVGVVTATHFYGDGSNLTGLPAGITINTNADNRIITGSGTANTLNGESNLTFTGKTLTTQTLSYPETTELTTEFKAGVANGNRYLNRYIKLTNTYTGSAHGGIPIVWEANADGSNNKSYGSIGMNSDGAITFYNRGSGAAANVGSSLGMTEKLRIGNDGILVTYGTGAVNAEFNTSNGSGAYLKFDLSASGATTGYMGAGGQIVTGAAAADFGIRSQSNMVFSTGGSTERLRIKSDGRIGINANPSVNHEYLHIKPVGNNVLDLRYELNSDTDIRHKFYDNAGVWRGGFNYTTYANSSAYPNFHDSFYFLTDPGSNGTLATALRITNTGQFIKPLTYQFFLETSGTSVSGGWTKLTGMSLDSTHCTGVSNGTYWSNSNQRFTAPVTGTYNFFIGGFSPTAEGGGTNHRYMYLFRINGGNYKYGCGGNYSDNNTPMAGGSINYKLTVNDYVEVWYYSAISATWGNSSHRFFWGGILLG